MPKCSAAVDAERQSSGNMYMISKALAAIIIIDKHKT